VAGQGDADRLAVDQKNGAARVLGIAVADVHMVAQVLGAGGARMGGQIGGTGHGPGFGLADAPRDQAGIGQLADP